MVVSFGGRYSYIHTFESNEAMLSRVIFYLKKVNFLFLFSILFYVTNAEEYGFEPQNHL